MNKYKKALNDFEEELKQMYGCDEANMDLDISSIKELVERATPKKVMFNSENDIQWNVCPVCVNDIEQFIYDQKHELDLELKHCPNCGQALDWSNNNE